MTLTRTQNAERMRRNRASDTYREQENTQARARNAASGPRPRKSSSNLQRRFVGVDGEGGDINGRHEYLLLRAGNHTLQTGRPLTPEECLAFIADLPTDGVIYVGFFFDYDVTMIVRDLPPHKVARLVNRELRLSTDGRYTYPVDIQFDESTRYQVDYIPHKEFRCRRVIPGEPPTFLPWVVISDVGSFFQCSFVKALTEWDIGTPEERQMIADGKDKRASFGELQSDTDTYNALEIELLQRLMSAFRDVCRDTGYLPARWQGPGNLATAMLRRHGVPPKRSLAIPPEVVTLANEAYYGGRFETTRVGPVHGGAYQYDINSAYPAAMMELPCLLHGEWHHTALVDTECPTFSLSRVHFTPTEPAALYSFPLRHKSGSIYYPAEGQGVYWSVEIDATRHQDIDVLDTWTYVQTCDCQPFSWIPDLYAERIRLGKTAKGRVLKLSLNSLYGKQAQSIGAAPYANPVYAGLITAMTRAKLQEAAHAGPHCCTDCYMLATDAVFTGSPRDLPLSKSLGEWDAERHSDLFIVQPGLYFTDSASVPKTRGIPRQAAVEARERFYDTYQDVLLAGDPFTYKVPVELRQFTGVRIANARGKLDTAGQWTEVTKEVSFEWSTKRDPQVTFKDHDALVTIPKRGGPDTVSVPYSKDIGRMLQHERLQLDDQPDYADVLYGEEK